MDTQFATAQSLLEALRTKRISAQELLALAPGTHRAL